MTTEKLREMLVADVLERWPATAEVFNAHATACVGCVLAPFCTVWDAAVNYHQPPEQLSGGQLQGVAAGSPRCLCAPAGRDVPTGTHKSRLPRALSQLHRAVGDLR